MIKVILQFAPIPPKRGKVRTAGPTMTIYSSSVLAAMSDIAARRIAAEADGKAIIGAVLFNAEDAARDIAAGHKPMAAKAFNTEEVAALRVASVS